MANPWIQIVGSKKTGKTLLIESVSRELVSRGRRVCFIKHTHSAPTLEPEETDTARVRAAGAATTVLASDASTIVVRTPGAVTLDAVAFNDAPAGDIVLAEGFKESPGRKLVVAGGDLDIESLGDVVGVVGEAPARYDGPTFGPDDIDGICDLIERLAGPTEGKCVTELAVNGRAVPLNAFVQGFMASTLRGMIEALEGIGEPRSIEIRVTGGTEESAES